MQPAGNLGFQFPSLLFSLSLAFCGNGPQKYSGSITNVECANVTNSTTSFKTHHQHHAFIPEILIYKTIQPQMVE